MSSSDGDNLFDAKFYVSVVSGCLLLISEVMPFIPQMESNGILHFITNSLVKIGQQALKKQTIASEEEPLLPTDVHETQPESSHDNDNTQDFQKAFEDKLDSMETEMQKKIDELSQELAQVKQNRVTINEYPDDKKIILIIE